jgi:ABC-2 type transport system ATP-binding protein
MISVNNLSKSYNGQRVFSSLNFSVNKGEVLGIIGGNGSGKSTLLKILSKISLPDSGDILISPDISIDYLGHENMFYEEMSIEENIAFFTKFNSAGISEESNSKLKKSLGLDDIYMNKMYELSYGQAKKSGLYRIVLNNADLILLDEPFSGLDKKSVNNLIAIIQELTSNNKSLVISSNIIEIIESIATTTINMDNFNE